MTACILSLHSFVSEQLNAELSATLHPPGLEELSSVWFSFSLGPMGIHSAGFDSDVKIKCMICYNNQTVQARSFPVNCNLFPENLFVQLFTYLSL